MGGSASVLCRLTMAALAFGLVFGIPNLARAQAPQFQTAHLPWRTAVNFKEAAHFDNGWTRVLSETRLLLRRFATPYAFPHGRSIGAAARTAAARPLWIPNVSAYVAPGHKPTLDIGTIRATLTPVEFASGVAADSRKMQGVLVGLRLELVD